MTQLHLFERNEDVPYMRKILEMKGRDVREKPDDYVRGAFDALAADPRKGKSS